VREAGDYNNECLAGNLNRTWRQRDPPRLVVLGFLARSLIQTWLTKDMKRFETDLRSTADSELERLRHELKSKGDASIEQLKSQLQQAAIEHQVRFSNLHEKRAAVIADLYKRLVEAFWDGQQFVLQTGQSREEYLVAHKKILDFYVFVETHRIYLPEHICASLANFVDALRKPVISVYVYGSIDYPNPQTLKERNEAFMAVYEAFKNDIPAARKALEDEFRKILGGDDLRSSAIAT
jgi:hypothetical protein